MYLRVWPSCYVAGDTMRHARIAMAQERGLSTTARRWSTDVCHLGVCLIQVLPSVRLGDVDAVVEQAWLA
eukprot:COSAG06_NODE_11087_length_1569_cov_1.063946_2_plen_70_part_00